jgi:tetraacyldisaccharide 4'-kinase
MRVTPPEFWQRRSPVAYTLWPLSLLWKAGTALRCAMVKPEKAPVPVICVGNAVAGGSGKTPVVAQLPFYRAVMARRFKAC